MPKVNYVNETGEKCASVTTILGILNKPALVHAAWKLGIEGKDYNKEWEKKGSVGTLTHDFIKDFYGKRVTDVSEYSKNIIDKAINCYNAFFQWQKSVNLTPIVVEQSFVSKKLGVGATPDIFCLADGVNTLIDFKTGKDYNIYREHRIQILVYDYILEEFGYKAKQRIILKINTEEEKCVTFEIPLKLRHLALKVFKGLKDAYDNLRYFG